MSGFKLEIRITLTEDDDPANGWEVREKVAVPIHIEDAVRTSSGAKATAIVLMHAMSKMLVRAARARRSYWKMVRDSRKKTKRST